MTTDKTLSINVPVLARVEGEGALDLRIEDGDISDIKLRIFEPPRYFEKFLEGRNHQDVLDAVARICGICPVAYQMSAVQALESVFNITASPWVRDMRRVMYCGEWLQSHSLHIHMLAAPDFLGVNSIFEMARDNDEAVRRGLRLQTLGNDLIALYGARSVHPVGVCVGGFSYAPEPTTVNAIVQRLTEAKQDAEALIQWVASLDLPDDDQDFISVALQHSQDYPLGEGRIVSDQGLDISANEYEQHFTEHHIPHSTALHSLLGDKPYLVGPLARLNLNQDRLSPESREVLEATGITFPSRNMFHSIIARAVEIHYVVHEAARILEAYTSPDQVKTDVTPMAGTGFGCTEAPRGLLWHRYDLDDNGKVKTARIVPPTSQNQARIEQDLVESLHHFGLNHAQDMLRLHAEKVIRNYDPCISCATHFLKLSINEVSTVNEASTIDKENTIDEEKKQANDRMTFPRAAGQGVPETSEGGLINSIKVIGIGSPYGSDSLGWEVVKQLQQDKTFEEKAGLTLLYLDRPGPRLLDAIHPHDRVIIVDAMSTSRPAGSLTRLTTSDITTETMQMTSHNFGVADTLQLGSTLKRLPEDVVLLGLETGGDINWQYSQGELEQLLDAVRTEVSVQSNPVSKE